MKLRTISVGRPRLVMAGGQPHSTAIFKAPVEGPVRLEGENLAGDRQASLDVHGGPDKVVYCYPQEHYAHWSEFLGRDDLAPGQFGENFTTEGMLETEVRIGDRYRVGTAVVEVSQPRVPCRNLAIRMERPDFPRDFLTSHKSGFYLRLIEAGEVEAGGEITLIERPEGSITVHDIHVLRFSKEADVEALRAAAANPRLSDEWKNDIGRYLERLG